MKTSNPTTREVGSNGGAGDIIITTYGVHYEIDQIGFLEETSK